MRPFVFAAAGATAIAVATGAAVLSTDAPTTEQEWCRGVDVASSVEVTFPCYQDPVSEVPADYTWSEVATGPGNLTDQRRRIEVTPYPDGTGVCFYLNDVFNRCDATGELEGSVFHFYPLPTLEPGDVLRAEWTAPNGDSHQGEYTVPF